MEEREVRWTAIALKQKLDIYEFWFERNQSIAYPEKLEEIFDKTISLIKRYPFLGIKFDKRPIYFINPCHTEFIMFLLIKLYTYYKFGIPEEILWV